MIEKVTRIIKISFCGPRDEKQSHKEIMYKIRWANRWVYTKKFDGPIFYGNGEYSKWQSKNLRSQIKMLESVNSGCQQAGYDYNPELAQTLKENIKIALGL